MVLHGHWQKSWSELLADRSRPLADRMQAYYADYLPRIYRYAWYRTFLFAAIDDPKFARDYLNQVTDQVLIIVMREVRHQLGLPGPEAVPFHDREFEMVWGMHSTFAFRGLRVHVYGFPMPRDMNTIVADQVQSYL
jgi:hypothetical protein